MRQDGSAAGLVMSNIYSSGRDNIPIQCSRPLFFVAVCEGVREGVVIIVSVGGCGFYRCGAVVFITVGAVGPIAVGCWLYWCVEGCWWRCCEGLLVALLWGDVISISVMDN